MEFSLFQLRNQPFLQGLCTCIHPYIHTTHVYPHMHNIFIYVNHIYLCNIFIYVNHIYTSSSISTSHSSQCFPREKPDLQYPQYFPKSVQYTKTIFRIVHTTVKIKPIRVQYLFIVLCVFRAGLYSLKVPLVYGYCILFA